MELWQVASYRTMMGSIGKMQLQKSFSFGDGRDLFDTAWKYSLPENVAMKYQKFQGQYF